MRVGSGYVALGAAALHPSMAVLEPPPPPTETETAPLLRSALVAAALLLVPATAGLQVALGRPPDPAIALAASVTMSLLVVARLHVTVREMIRREHRFRAFMEFPGIAALVKDKAGRLVFMNDRAVTSNGLTGLEWRGRTDRELIDPRRAAEYAAEDDRVRRTGRPATREFRTDGNGSSSWWHTERFPIPGAPGYLGIVSLDISERVAAEAQAARLAAAVEQADEAVVISDPTGRIEYVNPAFERVTGYTAAEALGSNPRMLNSGRQPASFYHSMWSTLTAGQPWVADFINRTKDGTEYLVERMISSIRDAAG